MALDFTAHSVKRGQAAHNLTIHNLYLCLIQIDSDFRRDSSSLHVFDEINGTQATESCAKLHPISGRIHYVSDKKWYTSYKLQEI